MTMIVPIDRDAEKSGFVLSVIDIATPYAAVFDASTFNPMNLKFGFLHGKTVWARACEFDADLAEVIVIGKNGDYNGLIRRVPAFYVVKGE